MDLYKECNDKNLLKEDEFEATFCRVCKNRTCDRAQYSKSSWDERISSQLSRLITNPNLVLDLKGTQWEPLPDFDTLRQDFKGYDTWGPAIQVVTPPTENIGQLPTPPTLEPLIIPNPIIEQASTEVVPMVTTPQPMPQIGGRARVLNTEPQGVDIWIGGDKPKEESRIILPQSTQDPWEVPVKVGSTFKMKG